MRVGFDLGLVEFKCKVAVHLDNICAQFLANNPEGSRSVRHVDVRYHFTKEKIADQTVVVYHIPSAQNVADLFAKALQSVLFWKFVNAILVNDEEHSES